MSAAWCRPSHKCSDYGRTFAAWLDFQTHEDSGEIADAVLGPVRGDLHRLRPGCSRAEIIVVLGRWIDSGPHLEDLTDIRAAFRPVVSKRGFEVLPVRRVSCWVDEDRH